MINIAIVEDNQAALETLKSILAEYSNFCRVVSTSSSVDEHKEKAVKYDVIFLDIELNGDKNGFEYLDSVDYSSTPIVIISGHPEKYATKGYKFQVFDFVPKPFDPSSLLDCVKRLNKHLNKTSIQSKESKFLFEINGTDYYIDEEELVMIFTYQGYITLLTVHELITHFKSNSSSNNKYHINDLKKTGNWQIKKKGSMSKMISLLSEEKFVVIQDSYILNSDFILKNSKEEIELEVKALGQYFKIHITVGNTINPSYLERFFRLIKLK